MGARLMTSEEIAEQTAQREQAMQAPEVFAARQVMETLRENAREAAELADREAYRIAELLLEAGHDSDVVADTVGLGRGMVGCMADNMRYARQRAASDPLTQSLNGNQEHK